MQALLTAPKMSTSRTASHVTVVTSELPETKEFLSRVATIQQRRGSDNKFEATGTIESIDGADDLCALRFVQAEGANTRFSRAKNMTPDEVATLWGLAFQPAFRSAVGREASTVYANLGLVCTKQELVSISSGHQLTAVDVIAIGQIVNETTPRTWSQNGIFVAAPLDAEQYDLDNESYYDATIQIGQAGYHPANLIATLSVLIQQDEIPQGAFVTDTWQSFRHKAVVVDGSLGTPIAEVQNSIDGQPTKFGIVQIVPLSTGLGAPTTTGAGF